MIKTAVIIEKRQVEANLSCGDEHSCPMMEGDFSQGHARVVRDGIHVPVGFLLVYIPSSRVEGTILVCMSPQNLQADWQSELRKRREEAILEGWNVHR